ncbi:MAG: CBS domain-containing protein [Nitrospira sp.]|nr:MAG: CBS domain-containing protein [Nitrospira sp.]
MRIRFLHWWMQSPTIMKAVSRLPRERCSNERTHHVRWPYTRRESEMVPVKSFMIPREKFVTVPRDTDTQTAARIMRDRGIGSLFVTNDREIIGIITDTDMMRRVVAAGTDATKTTVEQIMSAPIMTIEENKTILDANDLMAKSHLRHLGVTREGVLVGLISVRDLVVFLTNLPRK